MIGRIIRAARPAWDFIKRVTHANHRISHMLYEPLILDFKNLKAAHDLEIVVLVPVSPFIRRQFINSTIFLVQRAALPFRRCRLVFDSRGEPPPTGKPHPYRQTALAKIRQDMVENFLQSADWVIWTDADIVDYPANLFSELIIRADGGIASPILLMDGQLGSGPAYNDGFGWGKFYDVAGFVEGLRWV